MGIGTPSIQSKIPRPMVSAPLSVRGGCSDVPRLRTADGNQCSGPASDPVRFCGRSAACQRVQEMRQAKSFSEVRVAVPGPALLGTTMSRR